MVGAIEKKITLDLGECGVQNRILVRQGDSLVYRVTVTITKNGRPFFPDDVILAQVRAELPSGKTVVADCGIEGGKCTFIPGAGFFCHGGPVLCRLVLRGADGGELYSPTFAFDAETTFSTENATDAESYSRIAELLFQVREIKKECEQIASSIGIIDTVRNNITARDQMILYNTTGKSYERVPWTTVRATMKNALDGELMAVGVFDEAGSGCSATIPELEDDDYIVVGAQLEALADRVAALESKVK